MSFTESQGIQAATVPMGNLRVVVVDGCREAGKDL